MSTESVSDLSFLAISLPNLDALDETQRNQLPFGVIGLSPENLVEVYNSTESRLAGLSAASVLGTNFFLVTAQCMNNFMVAQRFEDGIEIDAEFAFVLTFRMRPTPVRLRLLKGSSTRRHYVLVQR